MLIIYTKREALYKEIAIIAPTASGKTALSIELAHKYNAIILSLDSLAVYKEIDIASAKPTLNERDGIIHFGVDKIYTNEKFDVVEFIEEYKSAKNYAMQNHKNLIIVGGTGFYLKSLLTGLSNAPKISLDTTTKVDLMLQNISKAYEYIREIDEKYMSNIEQNDLYRVRKALEIYYETNTAPSEYFKQNPQIPIIDKIDIFEIETDVDVLRKRIQLRTKIMIESGLIDEVIYLEKKYTRLPNPMSSIGIIETLDYLDGRVSKIELEELISIHTAQLAKRQRTFNKSQFENVIKDNLTNLEKQICKIF